jgi:hypothetical protein
VGDHRGSSGDAPAHERQWPSTTGIVEGHVPAGVSDGN